METSSAGGCVLHFARTESLHLEGKGQKPGAIASRKDGDSRHQPQKGKPRAILHGVSTIARTRKTSARILPYPQKPGSARYIIPGGAL